jgi:hypothetical protein
MIHLTFLMHLKKVPSLPQRDIEIPIELITSLILNIVFIYSYTNSQPYYLRGFFVQYAFKQQGHRIVVSFGNHGKSTLNHQMRLYPNTSYNADAFYHHPFSQIEQTASGKC